MPKNTMKKLKKNSLPKKCCGTKFSLKNARKNNMYKNGCA